MLQLMLTTVVLNMPQLQSVLNRNLLKKHRTIMIKFLVSHLFKQLPLRAMWVLDHSAEQSLLHTSSSSSSVDIEEWKCRECGYLNKMTAKRCETCSKAKPIHPLFERHLSYTRRTSSPSPCDRRSPSPEIKTMSNRTGSLSQPKDRREPSLSDSSDSNQHLSSRNIKKQKRSSSSKYHRISMSIIYLFFLLFQIRLKIDHHHQIMIDTRLHINMKIHIVKLFF